MLRFRDFVPKVTDPGGFLFPPVFEKPEETLATLNAFVELHRLDVVNIETVVLPNMHSRAEEGSTDPSLHTGGESASTWHQIYRVWYRYEGP